MAPSLTVAVDTDSAAKVLVMVRGCTRSDQGDCTAHRVERAARRCRVRSWYAHMVLIHLSEFGAEAARGLVLPTLFTYVQELGGGLEDVGLLTALFSVGRFFSSLLFGWLCDRTSFRVLYNVAGACSVLGNLMYVLPYSSSVRSRTLLAVSRLVIGFGAGNRSVCRANIAMLTRVDQRLEYFTLFATVVFLAYALTPGFGSVIGETQIEIATDLLQFNRFTAPGFLLVALNLFTILVNNMIYDESISRDDAPGSPTVIVAVPASSESTKPNVNELTIVVDKLEKSTDIVAEKKPTQEVTSPIISDQAVIVGMLVFIFLNFIARGILSIFETVNVPLFLQLTNRNTIQEQDSVEATRDASTFYLVIGLLGLISYGSVHVLRKKVSDTGFLLFGFAMLLVGNAILLIVCAGMHVNDERSDDADDADHSQQQFDIFATAEVFVWSVGCPLTSAVVVSTFSKVLGSRPQGLLMGVFGASASVARMVLPFLPSLLASWPLLFLVNMVLCAVCILVLSLYLGFISGHGTKTDGRSTVAYDSVQLHSDGREAD